MDSSPKLRNATSKARPAYVDSGRGPTALMRALRPALHLIAYQQRPRPRPGLGRLSRRRPDHRSLVIQTRFQETPQKSTVLSPQRRRMFHIIGPERILWRSRQRRMHSCSEHDWSMPQVRFHKATCQARREAAPYPTPPQPPRHHPGLALRKTGMPRPRARHDRTRTFAFNFMFT